jgi:hypothetical protein
MKRNITGFFLVLISQICLSILVSIVLMRPQLVEAAITDPPNMPENVIVYPISSTKVMIKWADSSSLSNPAQKFHIEKSPTGEDPFTTVASIPATTRNYTATVTKNSSTYFRVRASGVAGDSIKSDSEAPILAVTSGVVFDAKRIGSSSQQLKPLRFKTNSFNEKVIMGVFKGSADFGNGNVLVAEDLDIDYYFVSKYDASGNCLWAKAINPGSGWNPDFYYEVKDIAIANVQNADVAITGTYYDLNNTPQIFVAKYVSATGAFKWPLSIIHQQALLDFYEAEYQTYGNAIAMDTLGNVFITGEKIGYEEALPSGSGIGLFTESAIVNKYASSDGSLTSISFTGSSTLDPEFDYVTKKAIGRDIAVDSSNAVLVLGDMINETATAYKEDVFVKKYTNALAVTPTFSKLFSGLGNDPDYGIYKQAYSYSLAVDTAKNVIFLVDSNLADGTFVPKIYKISGANGAIFTGFPKTLLSTDTILSFQFSRTIADSLNNIWIVNSGQADLGGDFRKYNSSGVLQFSKYLEGFETSLYPTNYDLSYIYDGAIYIDKSVSPNVPYFQVLRFLDAPLNLEDLFYLDVKDSVNMYLANYSDTAEVNDDKTPPTGQVILNCGGVTSCNLNEPIIATLQATDSGSGMGLGSSVRFSEDGEYWQYPLDYATQIEDLLNIYEEGSRSIYFQFKDVRHNWTPRLESNSILIDWTPPEGTISFPIGNNTSSRNVTLNLTATDELSGVAYMQFSNDDGITYSDPEPFATTKQWVLSPGNGTKSVYAQFIDRAGNVSSPVGADIVLDAIPTTYEEWQTNMFFEVDLLDPLISGLNADPDQDGIINLLEYAYNFVPISYNGESSQETNPFRYRILNNHFTIEYRKNVNATDLTYKITVKARLTDPVWDPMPHNINYPVIQPIASGTQMITDQDSVDVTTVSSRFYRLEVNLTGGSTMLFNLPFSPTGFYYTLTLDQNNSGVITSSPGNLNCGNNCSIEKMKNSTEILTAHPSAGYKFDGWSGACSGTNPQCVLTMNSSKNVSALYSILGCQAGETDCNGTCVDLSTDNNNCGSCGSACSSNQSCQSGQCMDVGCSSGLTDCSGTCVDLSTDNNNCGSCGSTCSSNQSCQSGQCMDVGCSSGLTDCSGTCVDLSTDNNNCGGCGTACSSNQSCQSGQCMDVGCSSGLTDCSGACVDTFSDSSNCGGCGTICSSDQSCQSGICMNVE